MAGLLDAAVLAEDFTVQRVNRLLDCTSIIATAAETSMLEA